MKQLKQLVENGSYENRGKDHKPVVKLVLPDDNCIWLLTEIQPEDFGIANGLEQFLCTSPLMIEIDLSAITTCGAKIDKSFKGKYPISVYEKAAKHYGRIVDDVKLLEKFAQ